MADIPSIHDSYEEKPDTYSAASEVAKNLIELFRGATKAMMSNDLKGWWIFLDAAYSEMDWILKEPERKKLIELWNKINPNQKSSYGLLKEYTLELRRLCKPFFSMVNGVGNPTTAVYR